MLLTISESSIAFLQISEIMYDPAKKDEYSNEFIEIYTDLNLENFTMQDLKDEDILKLIHPSNSNYSLIIAKGFNYSNINATIYLVDDTRIGNGLNNNNGDIIIIKNGDAILDVVHYYSKWGANNNGNSLCLIKNKWQECYPTPGQKNKVSEQEYNIKINEFLPNPIGDDNTEMPDGEWIELINLGDEVNIENFYLKDSANHKLYITQTNTYNTTIKKYLVIYTNGFSGFLNNEGPEKIQLFDSEDNLIDEVSYSYSTEGLSWSKIDNKWVLTLPTPDKENKKEDIDISKSEINIEKIYLGRDNKAKFGESIRVKLSIYKGNTTKTSISAWVEKNKQKVSKTTKINIEEKFKEASITIPIQIFPNCNNKFENGTYLLRIEGLNTEEDDYIKIEGTTKNLCEKTICSSEKVSLETCSETNINQPNSTIREVRYESTNKKSDRLAIYLFCLILTLIIIQLVVEKWKK
jgi:hypothetical protein